jgi:hypothetical protein
MEIATRAFVSLASKKGDLLENRFREVSGFEKKTLAQAQQTLRLAALLHDIGHPPFCHAAEQVFLPEGGHEQLTETILAEQDLLGGALDSLYGTGCAKRVAQILKGSPFLPPQLQVLKDLVSGQMDADRTDYLLRDSHHCGVEYGRFDYRRLIECLDLQENPHGGLEIALHRDGLHVLEALILARYGMNTQVYCHRLRRIYDFYLRKYAECLPDGALNTPDKVLANNDVTMMARILEDASSATGERKEWARRIRERDHHRTVYETGADASWKELRDAKELLGSLEAKFPGVQFILDTATGKVHGFLRPEDRDTKDYTDLSVIGFRGRGRPVGEASQILRHVPREFQCVRIFASVTREQTNLRNEIEEYAAQV